MPILLKRLALLLLTTALAGSPVLSARADGDAVQDIKAHSQPGPNPASQSHNSQSLKVQSMDFYYKLDAEARYIDLKNQWQGEHRGEIPIEKARELALEADHEADMDTPFTQWRNQGGPAPLVFSAKAHIYGTGQQALLNVPFTVTVRAKTGNLRVITDLQLTDFQTLRSSARWITISQRTIHVPAVAIGEDLLLPLMEFQMLDFQKKHTNQFPIALEVKVSSPALGSVSRTLPLLPDQFLVPVIY